MLKIIGNAALESGSVLKNPGASSDDLRTIAAASVNVPKATSSKLLGRDEILKDISRAELKGSPSIESLALPKNTIADSNRYVVFPSIAEEGAQIMRAQEAEYKRAMDSILGQGYVMAEAVRKIVQEAEHKSNIESILSPGNAIAEAARKMHMRDGEHKLNMDSILAPVNAIAEMARRMAAQDDAIARYSTTYQNEKDALADVISKMDRQIAAGLGSNAILARLNDSAALAGRSIAINACIGDFAKSYIETLSIPAIHIEAKKHSEQLNAIQASPLYVEVRDFVTGHLAHARVFQTWFDEFTRPVSLAFKLIAAIDEGNDEEVARIASLPEFGVSAFRAMLNLARAPDSEKESIRIESEKLEADNKILKATIDNLESQKKKIEEAGVSRTQNARETKLGNSKIPDIKHWFGQQQKAGRNLMDLDVSSEAAKLFEVSASYIRILRTEYLKESNATSVR